VDRHFAEILLWYKMTHATGVQSCRGE